MGEGLNATGALAEGAMARAIEAISELVAEARRYEPVGISALGMEAFRRASNGPALARRIGEELGIPLRILAGEEEAQMGREGVLLGYGAPLPSAVLVVDVGGGSSELALTSPSWQVSVPRGAVTTSEAFLHADPPSADEVARMRTELGGVFADAWRACPDAGATPAVVAVGGTVTTYGAIQLQMSEWDSERVHRLWLSRNDIHALTDRLASMTLAERCEVPGLHPGRAPYVLGGGAILESVLGAVGADGLHISVANLLHAHVVHEAERWRLNSRAS